MQRILLIAVALAAGLQAGDAEPIRGSVSKAAFERQTSSVSDSRLVLPTDLRYEGRQEPQAPSAAAQEKNAKERTKKRAEGIQDNSFLIEEAYNQEPGVVQHIFNFVYSVDKLPGRNDRTFAAVFTQEWPVVSQRHQLSYTVPYEMHRSGGHTDSGVGNVFINYRYQALMESDDVPAFAPRISFILPTGDDDRDFGNGKPGVQLNLPVSKVLNESFTVHFNAGLTVTPRVNVKLDDGSTSPKRTLLDYTLGGSVIYAPLSRFNLMAEFTTAWEAGYRKNGQLDRRFVAIASPGVRYAVSIPSARDAQLVLGVAAPVGLTAEAPDIGVFGYISFEHNF